MAEIATLRSLVAVIDGRHRDDRRLGGKAVALDRLVAHGCDVPASAVLTTDAYALAVVDGPLAALIRDLRSRPIPDPTQHVDACTDIDRAFLDAPLPVEVTSAISSLAAEMTGGDPDVRLAIRSSATAEDLDAASFAGQYRTSLDVVAADVERAVRLTWASLWHPAPRAYRTLRGLGDDVAMAVLAMRMIDPHIAGVLFTRDPVGSPDDMRLEWVAGLGEALVSGSVTPESRTIRRDGRERDATARLLVGDDDATGRALVDLVDRALGLEAALGAPQDVEWAIDHQHRLWFLQARPITGDVDRDALDDGFDVRHGDEAALTTAGLAEMLPGVIPPLVWDVTSRQVEDGFRVLFDRLGAPLDDLAAPHALVARIHGRAAIDLDRLRAAAAAVPGGSAAELERRYFGERLDHRTAEHARSSVGLRHAMRLLLDRSRSVLESEIVVRAVDALVDREPAGAELAALDDAALLAYRDRVLDLGARTAAAEIAIAALATAAFRGAETAVAAHLGDDVAATLVQQATRTERRTGAGALRFDVLDDVAGVCERLDAIRLPWADAERSLAEDHDGRRFLAAWHDVLRRAGSTAVFAGPTWSDVPELAWLAFQAARDPHAARRAGRRDEALGPTVSIADVERAIRQAPPRTGAPHHGAARRHFLRRELADARELLDRRERTKTALLVLGGVARRADDELGRRLLQRGAIDEPDDVRLVSDEELRALVVGALAEFATATPPSTITIAHRRRRGAAAQLARPLPRLFRGDPAAEIALGAAAAATRGGAVRRGWAASPGWYDGPARVVGTPRRDALRRGEVLVASATDASWAPLFHVAGAIVVEQGGPLSHAAIVARELGVPAVVNVPGIVAELRAAAPGTHLTSTEPAAPCTCTHRTRRTSCRSWRRAHRPSHPTSTVSACS
jgi:phosphohistidine swiveling domain-containing protein